MPKLLPQRLAVAVQVLRHVEMVFQSEGLQSLWQSVRQGRTNFRGMCEMVFQSEELQSMWQSVERSRQEHDCEAVADMRRAADGKQQRSPKPRLLLCLVAP